MKLKGNPILKAEILCDKCNKNFAFKIMRGVALCKTCGSKNNISNRGWSKDRNISGGIVS